MSLWLINLKPTEILQNDLKPTGLQIIALYFGLKSKAGKLLNGRIKRNLLHSTTVQLVYNVIKPTMDSAGELNRKTITDKINRMLKIYCNLGKDKHNIMSLVIQKKQRKFIETYSVPFKTSTNMKTHAQTRSLSNTPISDTESKLTNASSVTMKVEMAPLDVFSPEKDVLNDSIGSSYSPPAKRLKLSKVKISPDTIVATDYAGLSSKKAAVVLGSQVGRKLWPSSIQKQRNTKRSQRCAEIVQKYRPVRITVHLDGKRTLEWDGTKKERNVILALDEKGNEQFISADKLKKGTGKEVAINTIDNLTKLNLIEKVK